jgi:tetratricopeptide (TPR) repeat protein
MRRYWSLLVIIVLMMSSVQVLAQTDNEKKCDQPSVADAKPSYYIGLGDSRFTRKDYANAVKAYTCAADLQPDYAPIYVRRGFAYAGLQDSQAALADYSHALELDENLVSAYNNRGTLYAQLGNFGLAINDFTLVITLDPNNAIAYNNRGIVHAAEGNFEDAIADFQEAISLDPTYSTPHASLAAVYSALAAKSYQEYMKVAGSNGRLPAGTPTEVLTAVDDSLRNGDFSVWLPLLTPSQ